MLRAFSSNNMTYIASQGTTFQNDSCNPSASRSCFAVSATAERNEKLIHARGSQSSQTSQDYYLHCPNGKPDYSCVLGNKTIIAMAHSTWTQYVQCAKTLAACQPFLECYGSQLKNPETPRGRPRASEAWLPYIRDSRKPHAVVWR